MNMCRNFTNHLHKYIGSIHINLLKFPLSDKGLEFKTKKLSIQQANPVQKCSLHLVTYETQIKPTVTYHSVPTMMIAELPYDPELPLLGVHLCENGRKP